MAAALSGNAASTAADGHSGSLKTAADLWALGLHSLMLAGPTERL